jgi:hypothetical protein
MENSTQITVADLSALHGIVDIAASRGAFRGAELTQVGAVFDKLTTFLNDVMAQAKATAEANAEETSNPDVAEPTGDTLKGE